MPPRSPLAIALVLSACGPSLPPPRAESIPPGVGWFCFDVVELSMTTCSRSLDECERGRRVSSGSCALRATAWCHTATSRTGGAFAICGGSKGDCERFRENLSALGDERDASACAELR